MNSAQVVLVAPLDEIRDAAVVAVGYWVAADDAATPPPAATPTFTAAGFAAAGAAAAGAAAAVAAAGTAAGSCASAKGRQRRNVEMGKLSCMAPDEECSRMAVECRE